MKLSDDFLALINSHATSVQEFNYLRRCFGLKSNGIVRNVFYVSPKPTKKYVNIGFRCSNAEEWKGKFEEAGVPVQSKRKGRLSLKLTREDFDDQRELINGVVADTVREAGI